MLQRTVALGFLKGLLRLTTKAKKTLHTNQIFLTSSLNPKKWSKWSNDYVRVTMTM